MTKENSSANTANRKIPMVIDSRDFSRALADAGVFPHDMLNSITGIKIIVDPAEIVTIELTILADKRIYDIMDPKIRKTFTVEDDLPQGQPGVAEQDQDWAGHLYQEDKGFGNNGVKNG